MALFRNQKARDTVLQTAFIGGLVAIVVIGVLVARQNLATQGISLSLAFPWKSTGWEMSYSLLPTERSDPYWWYLVSGTVNTLFLGVISLISATFVGGLVGIARISKNKALRLLGTIYVETFRNIPHILQIFFWYSLTTMLPSPRQAEPVFGTFFTSRGIYIPGFNVAAWAVAVFYLVLLSMVALVIWYSAARRFRRDPPARRRLIQRGVLGGGLVLMIGAVVLGHAPGTPWLDLPQVAGLNVSGGYRIKPELYALAFAIAIAGGAGVGEIFRGGFKAVGHGQTEAAMALGLSPWQAFSRVRFPLAMRAMLPMLANQHVWLMKATTLGIIVGYSDLFMVVTTSITQSGQTFEFIGILMVVFIVINITMAKIFNLINEAVKLKGHQLRS